jgi:hypothetical protein
MGDWSIMDSMDEEQKEEFLKDIAESQERINRIFDDALIDALLSQDE